jgi:hypothetical protein
MGRMSGRVTVAFKDVDNALIGIDAELVSERPRLVLGGSDKLPNDLLEFRHLLW